MSEPTPTPPPALLTLDPVTLVALAIKLFRVAQVCVPDLVALIAKAEAEFRK